MRRLIAIETHPLPCGDTDLILPGRYRFMLRICATYVDTFQLAN